MAADARSGGQESSGRVRRILVGHSLGAACAAAEVIDNPEVRHLTNLVAVQYHWGRRKWNGSAIKYVHA